MTIKTVSLLLALACSDAFVVQYSASNKFSTIASLEAHSVGESWGQIAATAAISAMLLANPLPALADGRCKRRIGFIREIRQLSRDIQSHLQVQRKSSDYLRLMRRTRLVAP